MNGKLVDTNILIYLSKRQLQMEEISSPKITLFISVITYMEVLGYKFESSNEKRIIEALCRNFPIIDLNPKIIDKVISIKQQYKIKLPDAIILSTAIISKMNLITANVNDFIDIEPELKIINPMIQ